jgi:multicomponent K+:H+ antiporter subunit G
MIIELLVSALLLVSGAAALIAALGLLYLPDFFLRMHAPGLVYSLASWSVTLASILHFTNKPDELSLHVWLIIILLSIGVPVTTVLLARAALFRGREAGEPLPKPLLAQDQPADH